MKVFTEVKLNIICILLSLKNKKVFLQFDTHKNAFRVLDTKTMQISTPFKSNLEIRDMRLTKKEDRLIILDYKNYFNVIDTSDFKLKNKFKPSINNSYSFVFAGKSCEMMFVNLFRHGLCKINLVSHDSQKFRFKGINSLYKSKYQIFPNHNILFGAIKNNNFGYYPASYNIKRGFKYRLYAQRFSEFYNRSNTLTNKDSLFVSGDYKGKLNITDLRSYRWLSARQLEKKKCIDCLVSTDKMIYGGTSFGEVFMINNTYPFSVIYYQKINHRILSIAVNQKYLVVGGNFTEPITIFKITDSNEESQKIESQ